MMISTSDFKKGLRVELDGAPWTVVSVTTQSPTARGATTLIKARLKNILTGQVSDRTFKSGDRVGVPNLEVRPCQYLYSGPSGDDLVYYFMDLGSYDQFELREEEIGDQTRWLVENLECRAVVYNDRVVGLELPQFVEVEISSVEPGARGDTATGSVTSAAYTTTGQRLQVPLFIKEGDRVRVDPVTGLFKDRL
jgi:elongation factor P